MTDLITEYADYDVFARTLHLETLTDRDVSLEEARERGLLNEQETRQLWQLLGLLEEDSLLIQLPKWLADEKIGSTERATPTMFVGEIARETEDAILFEESAAARPLLRLVHRIYSLENGLETTEADTDRQEQLENRLRDHRHTFENRDDVLGLADEWLPKSQLRTAVQRHG